MDDAAGEKEALENIYFDSSRPFDTVSYSILVDKLGKNWTGCVNYRVDERLAVQIGMKNQG